MSAPSTNVVQTNTDPLRPILRPIYYILRPGNRLVPLIAGDELPCWLKVVGSYHVDVTNTITVNKGEPYPRKGEYDIVCQYCVDATEHMHRQDPHRYDANQEEQSIDALMERGYAPTAHNKYLQRVPATSETPVQHLIQPTPVRASHPQFLQPAVLQSAQFPQPAQIPQLGGPSNLPPIQPAQTIPPFMPTISSLSLPSMPSLPSQPSGLQPQALQQAVQQAIQLQLLHKTPRPQQQQLQYQQQQMYLPQQPLQQQQSPDQGRGRTRDRNQQYNHVWQQSSQPRQQHRRLLPVQPDLKSRSPVLNVRQGEETRGLDATAPAFVPSATPLPAAPPAAVAASVDGSAVVVKR